MSAPQKIMTSQDFLFISLAIGFLVAVGFLSYSALQIANTFKEMVHVVKETEGIVKDTHGIVHSVRGVQIKALSTLFFFFRMAGMLAKGRR